VDRIIGCMRRAGLSEWMRLATTESSATSSLATRRSTPASPPWIRRPARADLRSWEVEYRSVPADLYPNIAAVSSVIPSLDDPANFETAVELMIEAISARAVGQRKARRGS